MKDIIEVKNLSKKYRYGETQTYLTLRDSITYLLSKPFEYFKSLKTQKLQKDEFWALKNVSFKVKSGEVLGIIGPNGAGKSTLLKVLSKITPPSSGEIVLRGRVTSLLEVGTGFHQELTGRENIYLNGAILGMTRKEIKTKFDEIVEFSGVEKFLDTPVKRYSSGMYVRLAFSVAAHLSSEILLVDEVLSVGDADFQDKCLTKIHELVEGEDRTILFVSHNLGAISQLCDRVLLINEGLIIREGQPREIVDFYRKQSIYSEYSRRSFSGNLTNTIRVKKITLNKAKGHYYSALPEDKLEFVVEGRTIRSIEAFRFTFAIFSESSRLFSVHDVEGHKTRLKKGSFRVYLSIPPYLLRPGRYSLAFGGHDLGMKNNFWGENVLNFEVLEKWSKDNQKINVGIINPPGCISFREQ